MSNPNSALPTAVVNPMVLPSVTKENGNKQQDTAVWRWNGNQWIMGAVTSLDSVKFLENLPTSALPKLENVDSIIRDENLHSSEPVQQSKSTNTASSSVINDVTNTDTENVSKETFTGNIQSKQTIIYVSGKNKTQEGNLEQDKTEKEFKSENCTNSACDVEILTDPALLKSDKTKSEKLGKPSISSTEKHSSSTKSLKEKVANRKRQRDNTIKSCTSKKQKIENLPVPAKKAPSTPSKKVIPVMAGNRRQKKEAKTTLTKRKQKKMKVSKFSHDAKLSKPSFSPSSDSTICHQKCLTKYIPCKGDILQRFSFEIVTCAFCHLPANFLCGLGDLYGPFQPTYHEILNKYNQAHEKFDTTLKAKAFPSTSSTTSKKNEICFNRDNNTCFFTSSAKTNNASFGQNKSSSVTTNKTEDNISLLKPQLGMLQAVDCILNHSGKKLTSRRSKKIQIPGFTGNVTFAGSCGDKTTDVLPNIDTLVFVEPTLNLSHEDEAAIVRPHVVSQRKKRHHNADSTSVSVMHKFNTKAFWTHSACALWSPGVYLVDSQLVGIASAVSDADDSVCSFCSRSGATIPCRNERGLIYHFPCALARGLQLDEETLTATFSD